MADALRRYARLTAKERAARFYARERRLAAQGVPRLSRTRQYALPSASITDGIDDFTLPATWRTKIKITGASPAGLIFEIGNATTAVAAWVDGTDVSFRAGDTGDDAATATYTVAGGLPNGLALDLLFAVIPGSGEVRMWGNGKELDRATAVGGALPNGWAADSTGAFAAAAQGALPVDVTQTGAPSDFSVVAPLDFFNHQVPQRFA